MKQTDIQAIKILAKPLVLFTEKYLIKQDKPPDITLEDSKSLTEILSIIEKVLPVIKKQELENPQEEDILFTLWGFKELLLKTLVILLAVDRFYLILNEADFAERAQMLHDRLIAELTNKALESNEVREALNKGNINEELEKRKEKINLMKKRITKIKDEVKIYNKKQVFFEQIPDDF